MYLNVLGDKKYRVDLKELMRWVSETPSSEKNITTLITQTYPMLPEEETDISVATKEITENKSSLNDTMNNIRYDIIKQFLTPLLSDFSEILMSEEDNENNETDFLSFSQRLSFNTLLQEGIITEIND